MGRNPVDSVGTRNQTEVEEAVRTKGEGSHRDVGEGLVVMAVEWGAGPFLWDLQGHGDPAH